MRTSIAVIVFSLLLFGAGCAPAEQAAQTVRNKIAEGAAEGAIKAQTGADVDVNVNNNGLSFTDPKTGRSFSAGDNVSIPSNFPRDVPVYAGATPTSVSVFEEQKSASLLLITADDRNTVKDWYATESESLGWTKEGIIETADNIILSFSRAENGGTARMTVNLPPKSLDGKTQIIIGRNGAK